MADLSLYPFSARSNPLPNQSEDFGLHAVIPPTGDFSAITTPRPTVKRKKPSSEIPPVLNSVLNNTSNSSQASNSSTSLFPDYLTDSINALNQLSYYDEIPHIVYLESKGIFITPTGLLSVSQKTPLQSKTWSRGLLNNGHLYFRPKYIDPSLFKYNFPKFSPEREAASQARKEEKRGKAYPVAFLVFEAFRDYYPPFFGKYPRGMVDIIFLDGNPKNTVLTNLAVRPPQNKLTKKKSALENKSRIFYPHDEYGVEISKDGWLRKQGIVETQHYFRPKRRHARIHATDHRLRNLISPSAFRKAYFDLFGDSWEGGFHPDLPPSEED